MTEKEYIQVENLTSLRVIRNVLAYMISDDVHLNEGELTELRKTVSLLIQKYEGLELEPNA